MGFSLGFSKNKSKQSGSFNQRVAGFQVPYLNQLFSQAGNLFGQTLGGMQGLQGGVSNQLGNIFGSMQNPWQGQLQGGAYQNVDANRIISGLERSMQSPSQMGRLNESIMGGTGNTFLGGMEDILRRQSQDRLNTGLRSLDQRAAAAGMGGSSPYRNLQQQTVSDAQQGLADRMGRLGYETFDKDLGLKMDIARQADAANLERQRMLTGMLGDKQAAMQGGLNFGQNMAGQAMGQYSPFMMPWQTMGMYANAIGNPLVLGRGTMSSKASGSSKSAGFGIPGFGK